ncbi:MAG TPA: DinB family protein [Bacteroidota bacterium]|nr:DinB family protein [Bacteroidota bacterium]
MKPIAAELRQVLDDAYRGLALLSEEEASTPNGPDKWSKKEILGHLIDSAANNHQRFVRAQLGPELHLPGYQQEEWVTAQRYRSEPWANILQLWRAYNIHLIHVIESVPAEALKTRCFIDKKEAVTLEFIIRDYLRHFKHHVEQILGPGYRPS